MSWFATLLSNVSAVVALIGATITLGTFAYRDFIDRKRRVRLAISTLGYQIFLLEIALKNSDESAPLLSPSSLLQYADIYIYNTQLLSALGLFNENFLRWERCRNSKNQLTATELDQSLLSLKQALAHIGVGISSKRLT